MGRKCYVNRSYIVGTGDPASLAEGLVGHPGRLVVVRADTPGGVGQGQLPGEWRRHNPGAGASSGELALTCARGITYNTSVVAGASSEGGNSAKVAQLVEHVTENHGVGSSILPLGTHQGPP